VSARTLRILGVHGLGNHTDLTWHASWRAAVQVALIGIPDVTPEMTFVDYDDIFRKTEISFAQSVDALWRLGRSGLISPFRLNRGAISIVSDRVRWTAGYVVAWVSDGAFKAETRARLLRAIADHEPDVILAHSLGSLITYDALAHRDATGGGLPALLGAAHLVTLGSQLGNPFVKRNLTNGRIRPLPVGFWHHLYNRHDDVFTAPIRLPQAPNFRQTDTPFDAAGIADHQAVLYLANPAAIRDVWQPLAAAATGRPALLTVEAAPRPREAARKAAERRPRQKALLVGINDYPGPAQRLEGCINDVFTMSAVLQQGGTPPEAIRTCLDARATTLGILDRLEWLLDDPRPADEYIFYYSGHGARVPEYGENFEPDHHVEALVPWDFDWSPERFISDDQICELYSQLPYDCRLIMIFDCGHSGGIHRDGGAKSRGITPPDDIRHRELKWDVETEMWAPRDFEPINGSFSRKPTVNAAFFGRDGATHRLGRASMLRGLSAEKYEKLKKAGSDMANGPYLPLIIEACREDQLCCEYRHGATSHGAFTYSLATILRRETLRKRKVSFEKLVKLTADQLNNLQFDQVPNILGPSEILDAEVPWTSA
jgi:metacaspase-1